MTLNFEKLRFFAGPPGEFWPAFVRALVAHCGAAAGLAVLREQTWRVIASHGPQVSIEPALLTTVADGAERDGFAFERLKETEMSVLGLRLETGDRPCVALLIIQGRVANLQAISGQLRLVADTPLLYQNQRRLVQADRELGQFSGALDLLLLLNAQTKFFAVAATFCNELASRFQAQRVSLGWKDGQYVRLQVVSHMERFERRMEVVQRMEATMEEALDQDEDLVFPAPEGSLVITRDHAAFSESQRVPYLASLPLRIDGDPCGVLMAERQDTPFTEAELRALRLVCDQSTRRLAELKEQDGWFGKRWARQIRKTAASWVGVEHTAAKLGVIAALTLLGVALFWKVPYRIEAPFMIRSEALIQVPAPFDGYLRSAAVRPGDEVEEGATLAELDDRDLLVEQAQATADLGRCQAEAEQAESENRIADMRVARQKAEQSRAALELARFRLSRTGIKAPQPGIVVMGDLRERIGSPVKRGELLFKISTLRKLYAELKVDERDVQEIREDASGEIAFTSRPAVKFPIRVEKVEPAAVAQEKANVFLVRCRCVAAPESWWRPGMSGLAKIDSGKRSLAWIFLHRAVDFLRMKFWW